MENDYYGLILRYLINNHNKNRAISKQEIKSLVTVEAGDINLLLEKVQGFASQFGLELVGMIENKESNLENAQKIFIRRADEINAEHTVLSEEEKVTFLIFSLVQVERSLEEEKLLRNKDLYLDLPDLIKNLKSQGYLTSTLVKDTKCLEFGWRFYLEYGNVFDVNKYKIF